MRTQVDCRRRNQKHAGSNIFAVRLSVTSLQSCKEEIPYSCPGFVSKIINNIGVSDVVRFLTSRAFVFGEELTPLLPAKTKAESARSPDNVMLSPGGCVYSGCMLDAANGEIYWAWRTFQISANERVPDRKDRQAMVAYNGAVVYYPQLSFEESNCYSIRC